MTYDLIIVSASIHPALIANTQNAINSCIADSKNVNVILIETGHNFKYININKHIEYNGMFNYNRALNLGLKYRKSDIQILANNDIVFRKGWSAIGDIMRANDILSASALSNDQRQRHFQRGDKIYFGYDVGFQLSGWCIFTDSKLWDRIDKLSEEHLFWFSDNAYASQLKEAGINHALICNVFVDHLGSQTLKRIDTRTRMLYTHYERQCQERRHRRN